MGAITVTPPVEIAGLESCTVRSRVEPTAGAKGCMNWDPLMYGNPLSGIVSFCLTAAILPGVTDRSGCLRSRLKKIYLLIFFFVLTMVAWYKNGKFILKVPHTVNLQSSIGVFLNYKKISKIWYRPSSISYQ